MSLPDPAPRLLQVGGREVGASAVDDFYRRASTLLGDFLQLKNLSVLFGAGPSYPLGSPRIRAVDADELDRLMDSPGVGDIHGGHRDLLKSMIATAGGSVDLESLLGSLSSGLALLRGGYAGDTIRLGGVDASEELVQGAQKALNRVLAFNCDLPVEGLVDESISEDPFQDHRTFFRRMLAARRPDLPRVRVFTLNYDLVIEQSLDQLSVPYIDGFQGGISRAFRPEMFSQDVYLPPEPDARRLLRIPEMLYLHKLHGSINWRFREDEGPSRVELVGDPLGFTADELAVVFPTPQKDADALGFPYAALLRHFAEALSVPDAGLLVVGYGFADDHVNRLIEDGLGNPTFQLFVCTPVDIRAGDVGPLTALGGIEDPRIRILAGAEAGLFSSLANRAMPLQAEPSVDEEISATQAAFRDIGLIPERGEAPKTGEGP